MLFCSVVLRQLINPRLRHFGDESGMAATGKIDEFDRDKEDWPQYVERVGHFFVANAIDSAERKQALFLAGYRIGSNDLQDAA